RPTTGIRLLRPRRPRGGRGLEARCMDARRTADRARGYLRRRTPAEARNERALLPDLSFRRLVGMLSPRKGGSAKPGARQTVPVPPGPPLQRPKPKATAGRRMRHGASTDQVA